MTSSTKDEEPTVTIKFSHVPEIGRSYMIRQIQDFLYKVKSRREDKQDDMELIENEEEQQTSEQKEIVIYCDFVTDTSSGQVLKNQYENEDVPTYERTMDEILPFRKENPPTMCFNCGRPDHQIAQCKEDRDYKTIEENKALYQKYSKRRIRTQEPNYRYFDDAHKQNEQDDANDKRRRQHDYDDDHHNRSPPSPRTHQHNNHHHTSKRTIDDAPSRSERPRRERSRTPIEIIDDRSSTATAPPTPTPIKSTSSTSNDNSSLKIYQENKPFTKDVTTVNEEFLFGGQVIQDPGWKHSFDDVLHKIKVHSTERQKSRLKMGTINHSISTNHDELPSSSSGRKPTKILGKRGRRDELEDEQRWDRRRSRSRSPQYRRGNRHDDDSRYRRDYNNHYQHRDHHQRADRRSERERSY
ncbi:hypothetical protein AKO1_012884 [Acrasis kona]|uniref:CCHC-type domain-containing protein n=1 Tax=Acrasis kona TaxID=1008807 RepID=A0AAW2YXT7_9EUKA